MKTINDLMKDDGFLDDVISNSLFVVNYNSDLDRQSAKRNLLKIHISGMISALNKRGQEIIVKKKDA